MTQKWNLQDIQPPDRKGGRPRKTAKPERPHSDMTRRRPKHEEREESTADYVPSLEIIDGNAARGKRIMVSVIVGLLVIAGGFLVSALMSGAEVTLYPKYKDINVQATFTAHTTPSPDELSYELLTLEAQGERQVAATGKEEVSERSTGNIFIYNAYSESTQRLIKNTRFESPEGLIYRIQESVEVPGSTTADDGSVIPGVISAEVFADGPGEQYNIGPSRFTVPGLEGSEQFEKIYAESTDSFNGGFEGEKFIIDEAELQTAKQALHSELRDALLERLQTERPAGFVLFEGAVTFVFDTLPATEYGDDLATIKERARLQVPIFEEDEFAKYLAENTIAGYEGNPVMVEDYMNIYFTYNDSATLTKDIATFTELAFDLKGNARIVWKYDENMLKSDIVGLSKTALPTVLSGYPAVERAEAVVRPFWKQSFPDKPSDIKIIRSINAE
jgi:hypothetical protein